MSRWFDWAELCDLTRGTIGIIDVACPLCGPECRAAANRKRAVLRIWNEGDWATYKCARCEAAGWAKNGRAAAGGRPRVTATPVSNETDRAQLARRLWARSVPALGSPVESYLRGRLCWIVSDNLRFLPPRQNYPAAMIARFGVGPITGVHLTRLAADGRGKAGTDKDKIMIGPSMGQPIVVSDNPERGELIVAEGIEDAATLALVTGWTAWAAGSAGRIAAVIAGARHFDRVFLAVDDDMAGDGALKKAMSVRGDICPLRVAKVLSRQCDANKTMQRFGGEALLAAIEWSEAQSRFRRGEIGFHAMQDAMARADGVFRTLLGDDVAKAIS